VGTDVSALERAAGELGVSFVKGTDFMLEGGENALRLAYAGVTPSQIDEGVGRLAAAYVRGLQDSGVGACLKHLVANESETERNTMDSVVDEATLRELYLLPFEIAVAESDAWSIMAAYNNVNGVPATEHQHVTNDIVKGEWAYPGLVMSDWFATHSTAEAINAGLDLETPTGANFSPAKLTAALNAGQIKISTINDKLVRRYATMIRFGLFDRTPTVTPIPAQADGAVARHIAEEGMVLLKNAAVAGAPILPLKKSALHSIALIGNDKAVTGGGGSSVKAVRRKLTTPLDFAAIGSWSRAHGA